MLIFRAASLFRTKMAARGPKNGRQGLEGIYSWTSGCSWKLSIYQDMHRWLASQITNDMFSLQRAETGLNLVL